MFSYLFTSKKEKKSDKPVFIKKEKPEVYIVIDKGTNNTIGAFSSLSLAIKHGRDSTYCNCIIRKFIVDTPCQYIYYPVYED